MLFFGHIGNTAGLVKLYQSVLKARTPQAGAAAHSAGDHGARLPSVLRRANARFIDYRLVLLGSMLPDIIDKPLWLLNRAGLEWASRGYSHTFLFNSILLAAGVVLSLRRNRHWLLTIAATSFIHLAFDLMWLTPKILWWPFVESIRFAETPGPLGIPGGLSVDPIQPGARAGWFDRLWDNLLADPYVYVSEALGLLMTLYVGLRLLIRKRLIHFMKTGDVNWNKSPRAGTTERGG